LLAAGLALPLAGLFGCDRPAPLLRVASIVWIGYEPLFLARELGYYDHSGLRLIEPPSSTDSLMALATGDVEAACLTLDECLIARVGGLDLRVVLVFDDSAGADAFMARPGIKTLAELRGKRVGVEDTANGALMLAKTLEAAGLAPADVVKVPVVGDRQVAAYQAGEVDAVVSFEPYATRLAGLGAVRLLDTTRFPGLIVDVLAVRAAALDKFSAPLAKLVDGYFRALGHLAGSPGDAAARMAPRMGIAPDDVLRALQGVHMMDRAANLAWLAGPEPRLLAAARRVGGIMFESGLLRQEPSLDRLADARFLGPVRGAAS
jgi:NitT/TauT family transport system substrate-binding protein